jgi:RND family efflux transporter MFP subunit
MLDDDELAQQLEQARAELDMARASVEDAASAIEVARSAVEVARKEFDRLNTLKQKGIASVADLDVAEAKLQSSEATLKANEAKKRVAGALVNHRDAAFKGAAIRLSYAQVHAAWQEGDEKRVVGERFVDEGTLLKVNDPIVTVLEDGSMTAVIHVIERDYPKVQIGQEAVVTTDAYPGKIFSGKIMRIAPLLKESSRQARLEIEILNADRLLKTGMFIRAQIEFARHDDATLVPVAALVKRGDKRGVFLADVAAAKVTFVPLTLGIISGERAEVVEPPLSGQVVVLGQHLLDDGGAISLPDAGKEPKPAGGPGNNAPRKSPRPGTGAGP